MRLSSNFSVGLVLGITTASVFLALSGCASTAAMSPAQAHGGDPADGGASAAGVTLADFSESERERILAVQDIVEQAAGEHDLDPALINAMIWVESRFDPRAKSSAGARGLMQLMPATAAYLAKRMGEHSARAYDPEFNVRAGSLYLAQMLDKFGDERLAVAAYHAGPGNVNRWVETGEDFPDYSQAYVAKVMDARARFEGVELHGRSSSERSNKGGAGIGASERELGEDEPLEVPDVDSLPDAADIHGMPRVIYSEPASKPEPEPRPRPIAKPVEPEPIEPVLVPVEPVFVVHPELDANPDVPPQGWTVTPAEPEQPRRPEPKPEPPAEQGPPAKQAPETGLGVLPDL